MIDQRRRRRRLVLALMAPAIAFTRPTQAQRLLTNTTSYASALLQCAPNTTSVDACIAAQHATNLCESPVAAKCYNEACYPLMDLVVKVCYMPARMGGGDEVFAVRDAVDAVGRGCGAAAARCVADVRDFAGLGGVGPGCGVLRDAQTCLVGVGCQEDIMVASKTQRMCGAYEPVSTCFDAFLACVGAEALAAVGGCGTRTDLRCHCPLYKQFQRCQRSTACAGATRVVDLFRPLNATMDFPASKILRMACAPARVNATATTVTAYTSQPLFSLTSMTTVSVDGMAAASSSEALHTVAWTLGLVVAVLLL